VWVEMVACLGHDQHRGMNDSLCGSATPPVVGIPRAGDARGRTAGAVTAPPPLCAGCRTDRRGCRVCAASGVAPRSLWPRARGRRPSTSSMPGAPTRPGFCWSRRGCGPRTERWWPAIAGAAGCGFTSAVCCFPWPCILGGGSPGRHSESPLRSCALSTDIAGSVPLRALGRRQGIRSPPVSDNRTGQPVGGPLRGGLPADPVVQRDGIGSVQHRPRQAACIRCPTHSPQPPQNHGPGRGGETWAYRTILHVMPLHVPWRS